MKRILFLAFFLASPLFAKPIAEIKKLPDGKYIWTYSDDFKQISSNHEFDKKRNAKKSLKRHLKKMNIQKWDWK